jgi:hypothetical protein
MVLMDFSKLEPSDHFLLHLGRNIWLMDDHRWALLVWERERKEAKYTLIHADQHWDAAYDFAENEEAEQELLHANVAQIASYLRENKLIRYDSFIAPAVRRGLFDTVHFFCTENDKNDIGFYEDFLIQAGATQVVYSTVESLAAAQFRHPVIFDLCLDLFNRSGNWMEGDLWIESEIKSFLRAIRHIVSAAEIVTISLSFNHSGTHDDTRRLARLVIPLLLSYRNVA